MIDDACPYCRWESIDGVCKACCPSCGSPLTDGAEREFVLQDILALVDEFGLSRHLTFREALPTVINMMDLARPDDFINLVVCAVRRHLRARGEEAVA